MSTDPIQLACRCGARLQLPATLGGHVGRCPGCGAALRAPVPERRREPVPSLPHEVLRVRCGCGRRIPAPRLQLEQGTARCPSCDRPLDLACLDRG